MELKYLESYLLKESSLIELKSSLIKLSFIQLESSFI